MNVTLLDHATVWLTASIQLVLINVFVRQAIREMVFSVMVS